MTKPFPRYFEIEYDIYVKVYEHDGEVLAINHWGNTFPPIEALYEGTEVSKSEFDNAVDNQSKQFIPNC